MFPQENAHIARGFGLHMQAVIPLNPISDNAVGIGRFFKAKPLAAFLINEYSP